MAANFTIDDNTRAHRWESRRTNPLRLVPVRPGDSERKHAEPMRVVGEPAGLAAAIVRQSGQLPGFAPLLDDLEIAGWSSHRRQLSGNFHDWLMLEGRMMLVVVGHAVGPAPLEATEAALVAQSAWATIRAHAHHVRDAGQLLSIAARSLWATPNAAVQAAVAVALLDTVEGVASLAMAGDCLAWRIRAAYCEPLAATQPMLGATADFTYASHFVQLSLRERLVLVADDAAVRPAKLAAAIATSFARLDAESHRRMLAADAVGLVRQQFEPSDAAEMQSKVSIVGVRRR